MISLRKGGGEVEVITAYLVLGPYDDMDDRVFGVFFDPVDADRACRRCAKRHGGLLQEYRVEEREVNRVWKDPV